MSQRNVGGDQPSQFDNRAGATGPDPAGSGGSSGGPPIAAPAAAQPPRWYHIPKELRDRPQWLLAVRDKRGACKVPATVNAYGEVCPGSSTGRGTWMPFDRAASWAWYLGTQIGYVLAFDDPYTCVDLDVKNVHNYPDKPGEWTTQPKVDMFSRMLVGFDTYAERSLSRQGLHLWARGKIGQGCKRDGVEVYSQERFIVCTGDVVLDRPIRERQGLLDMMVSQMQPSRRAAPEWVEHPPLESDDDHFIRKARAQNGAKFQELWFGRWQALGIGDRTQSCADMALVRMLCFNNPSNEQVRRMFLASALGKREKALRGDYVDGMIAVARAADAERERVGAQVSAAMAPYIDEAIAAYWAKWGPR